MEVISVPGLFWPRPPLTDSDQPTGSSGSAPPPPWLFRKMGTCPPSPKARARAGPHPENP